MARDELEYKKLTDLWNALINKQNAEKCLEQTNEEIRNLKPQTPESIPVLKKCTWATDALKEAYAAPYKKEAKRIADNKKSAADSRRILLSIVVIIAALALFALAVWMVVKLAQWGDQISFYKMRVEGEDASIYTGVHFLALSVLLAVIAAICFRRADDSTIWMVVSIGTVIAAVIIFIISLVKYWGVVDGFGPFIGAVVGIFLLIPDWFVALFSYAIVIVPMYVVPPLIIWGVIAFFDMSHTAPGSSKYYVEPKVDFSPLYNSNEYKSAQKKDDDVSKKWEKEYIELKKKYDSLCQSMYQTYLAKKKQLESNADIYKQKIAQCNSQINSATFIHSSYRNINMMQTIFYYINYNYADNLKEALNVYRDDEHKKKVLALEKARLDEIATHNRRMEEEARKLRQAEEAHMAQMRRQQAEAIMAQEANDNRRHQEMINEARNLNKTMNRISESANNIAYNSDRIKNDVWRATH